MKREGVSVTGEERGGECDRGREGVGVTGEERGWV